MYHRTVLFIAACSQLSLLLCGMHQHDNDPVKKIFLAIVKNKTDDLEELLGKYPHAHDTVYNLYDVLGSEYSRTPPGASSCRPNFSRWPDMHNHGNTVCLAAYLHYETVLQVLQRHGANLSATVNNRNALQFALSNPKSALDSVQELSSLCTYLLDAKVPLNTPGDIPSPLAYAAACQSLVINKLLLEHGAHTQDSALLEAAHKGNPDVCKLLLQHGASVKATDKRGQTALHKIASESPGSIARRRTISLLLKNNAPVDEKDGAGN